MDCEINNLLNRMKNLEKDNREMNTQLIFEKEKIITVTSQLNKYHAIETKLQKEIAV